MRTALASLFVLSMLAAAHLFMVVVNAVESVVDPPQATAGLPARMFTDRPLIAELEAALERMETPAQRRIVRTALAEARAGRPVSLRTLPVTAFLVQAALALTGVGGLLLWCTSRLRSDAAQTIVGIFGGNLLWTGGVEYGLTIAARSLGVGKTVGVVDGTLVAVYGEYVLLKHSWGMLTLIVGYLFFLESSRCPIFLWWRERVPMMRGSPVAGRIDNYGPRSAFQYATTVWAFYALLLWAYDEHVFGAGSLFTGGVLFLSLAATPYCLWQLHRRRGWGPALRYAVGAMIVVWTPVEILGKWGVLRQPWLWLHWTTVVTFFGGLAAGTWGLWHAQREARA